MIPGANLLATALSVIVPQPVIYYAFASRQTNTIGLYETTYLPGVTVNASVQAVSRDRYEAWGLDLRKGYIMVYALTPFIDIRRNQSGDQLGYNGRRFQAVTESDWFLQDKWTGGLLCVDVGPDNVG